jgi:heavy metal sensor kinase
MGWIFIIFLPLTLLFAGLGGYYLARKSLAPVAEMGRQASRMSAANLSETLKVKNEQDELGQLAHVFNEMLGRLDASFEQQRRFMADASHELRTPLSIVRGESEVALSKSDRAAESYRESLSIVHDESKRLTRIVEDLFMLARADAGQFRGRFEQVYVDEVVADAVRSISVLAGKRAISIEVESDAEMPMKADESLLCRLFANLLDNAVKYGRSGGRILVRESVTDDEYILTVTDDGIGIPPEEQARIFERFYRVDHARSRGEETETSGAGLGLAIAKWIAEMHHGKVGLVSSDQGGSVFSVRLPR